MTYASLAMLRDPGNPIVVLAYISLTVMGSDTASWPDLTRQLEPLCTRPHSQAPGIEELRREIEQSFRRTILKSKHTDALSAPGELLPDDLEV